MKTRAGVTGWLVFILFCILGSWSLIYTVFFILIGSLKYQWCYGYHFHGPWILWCLTVYWETHICIYMCDIYLFIPVLGDVNRWCCLYWHIFSTLKTCCSYMYMTAFLQYFWCISHIEFLISLLSSHCRILMPFIIIV